MFLGSPKSLYKSSYKLNINLILFENINSNQSGKKNNSKTSEVYWLQSMFDAQGWYHGRRENTLTRFSGVWAGFPWRVNQIRFWAHLGLKFCWNKLCMNDWLATQELESAVCWTKMLFLDWWDNNQGTKGQEHAATSHEYLNKRFDNFFCGCLSIVTQRTEPDGWSCCGCQELQISAI